MAYKRIPIQCPNCGHMARSFDRRMAGDMLAMPDAIPPLPTDPVWVVRHLERTSVCIIAAHLVEG